MEKTEKLNNRITSIIIFVLSILILYFTYYFITNAAKSNNIKADKGYLDLTQVDLEKSGPLSINGQWEFYWDKLLYPEDFKEGSKIQEPTYEKLPASWTSYIDDKGNKLKSEGRATYRLRVKLSKSSQSLGIKFNNIWGKGRLFIKEDGKSIEEIKTAERELLSNIVVKNKFFSVHGDEFEIILQLENDNVLKSGVLKSIYIGTAENILIFRDKYLFIDISASISLFMMFIYFASRSYQRKDFNSSVSLAIYSLTALVFLSATDEMLILRVFPKLSMADIYLLTILLGIISGYALVIYIKYSYDVNLSSKFFKCYGIICIIYMSIMCFTPVLKVVDMGAIQAVLGTSIVIYGMYIIIRSIVKRTEGFRFNILAILSIMLLVSVMIYNTFAKKQINFLVPFYIIIFILSQALLLSHKYFNSVKVIEELSNKLKFLDKRKDEFLERTSYELKLPLKGISNIAKSLIEGVAGTLSIEQKENVEIIASATNRLDILVDDILDYSNFANGYVITDKKAVNIKSILILVFNIVSYSVKDKPIVIENQMKGDSLIVIGDENRLKQVFYNLIYTMILLTDKGKIVIGYKADGQNALIAIKNNNLYIGEKVSVFNNMELIDVEDGTYSKKRKSCIGLWVAKEIVKLHGGEIGFSSTREEGTIFTVNLPIVNNFVEEIACTNDISEEVSSFEKSFTGVKEATGKHSVLILEPNQINERVISNALRIEGYNINKLSSGKELLEVLDKGIKEDLCIINSLLPNCSGYDLVREMRNKYSNIDLPILMIVDKSYAENISLALHLGANDVLIEPYDVSELKARVNTLIQLKKSVSALVNSEMAFLKAQIKPHFIFNVLSVISSLTTREPSKAKRLLLDFSDYLRSSFDFSSGEDLSPLSKEMELVKAYVAIEKERFKDRLHVNFFIEENIDISIPPLVIQPIVENAIRHGVLNKIEGGHIEIRIYREDTEIIINVKDDGVGIETHRLSKLLEGKDERAGVGIANINSRLIKSYGYGLSITSNLGQGTEVVIRVPVNNLCK